MEIQKSKVCVLLDERNRVLHCEGGYTMSNIDDVSKWTYIDEGVGTGTIYAKVTTSTVVCTPCKASPGISTRMARACCGATRSWPLTVMCCPSPSPVS